MTKLFSCFASFSALAVGGSLGAVAGDEELSFKQQIETILPTLGLFLGNKFLPGLPAFICGHQFKLNIFILSVSFG